MVCWFTYLTNVGIYSSLYRKGLGLLLSLGLPLLSIGVSIGDSYWYTDYCYYGDDYHCIDWFGCVHLVASLMASNSHGL